jgi:ATP/maltotriose-dependent transcriptional regulator MalT
MRQQDKIGIHAPLFRRHVRRPRLTSFLDESKAQALLLTAPPGYGKTTLAREWLQGRENVAWYRASPSSGDLAAFSIGLAEAIAPVLQGAGERLRQRLRVGDAPEKAARPLAELLAEDLADWPEDGMILVDDYHFVTDSAPVEEFVDWLLTLAPVRMLVTTRRRPAWASARRVLYGEVVEIGPEQLAMNDDEAGLVLEGRSTHAVRSLVRQARGWPALIGLAGRSASLELPEEWVSEALFRYFAEEVLRREPHHVQRFMLLASVPPTITPHVARTVLGYEDPEPFLERLKSEDLLHESHQGEMSFHPLLRDFLKRRLEAEAPDEFIVRSISACEDARPRREWEPAFDLAITIRRFDLAARILGEAAEHLLSRGRVETVEKWLADCGASAFSESGALLARGEVALRRGRFAEAAALASELTAVLEPEHVDLPRAWNLVGQASVLLADYGTALRSHLRARRIAMSQPDQMAALWGAFVSAAELEFTGASRYLDEFQKVAADTTTGRIRSGSGKIIASIHQGSFSGLWPVLKSLLPLARLGTEPMAASNFLANAACMNVGRAQYKIAAQISEDAVRFCRDLRLEFATGFCLCQLTASQIGLRAFRRAEQTLRDLSLTALNHEDPWLQLMTRILEVKLALAAGAPHRLVPTMTLDPGSEYPRSAVGEYLSVCAMALAAAGYPERAQAAASQAQDITQTIEATFYSRYAYALAWLHDPADPSTSERIFRIVKESQTAEFLDALVLAYRSSALFVSWLEKETRLHTLLSRLMPRANDHVLAHKLGLTTSDVNPHPFRVLTPREQEVLSLVAQGLSNDDIARSLFVTRSTVKVHVHHVLKKLGVQTRLQAVLKARAAFDETLT